MSKWLLSVLFAIGVTGSYAQTVTTSYSILWSHREVNPQIDNCPNPPDCHSHSYNSWDVGPVTGNFKEGNYTKTTVDGQGNVVYNEFMNFRAIFPPGYNKTNPAPYPMIIMLHGAGEGGRIWTGNFNFGPNDVGYDNNGKNITHGGQEHHWAVFGTKPPGSNVTVPGTWPGIVIWPQVNYNGAWESGWQNGVLSDNNRMAAGLIEYFIDSLNVDPDRVVIHGLSNGAQGVWDLVSKRPDLFAAMAPMSGIGTNMSAQTDVLVTTPIWMFQGGVDTNPNPQASLDWYNALVGKGGTPIRTVYPTLGHGTWQTAYKEPNFFSWLASKSIKNIYVFGGIPAVCPGNSLKLGFTDNFQSYEWYLNGNLITSDGDGDPYNRYLFATTPGTYEVHYTRFNGSVGISNPLIVNVGSGSDYTPVLTNTGSTYLPIQLANGQTSGNGVDNRINLIAPAGFGSYQWYKNGNPFVAPGQVSNVITSNTIEFSNNFGAQTDAGDYTVAVQLGSGCISQVSNPISVKWFSPQPTSPRPAVGDPGNGISPGPVRTLISPTQIDLSWPDYVGEVGYEVWRIEFGGATPVYGFKGWKLIKVLPANVTSFSDLGVRPNDNYNYIVRALRADGSAIFSDTPWLNVITAADVTPPSPPNNVVATLVNETTVNLSWAAPTDNDKVYRYEISNGSTLITLSPTTALTGGTEASTPPATSYAITGLSPNSTYQFSVRAIDYSGNVSPFSTPVLATTVVLVGTSSAVTGLDYRYYTYTGNLPDLATFDYDKLPDWIGISANFSLATATGGPVPGDRFVFRWEGYLDIRSANEGVGTYVFSTQSNAQEPSQLYIDLNDGAGYRLVVNNNGSSANEVSGTIDLLVAGKYPILLTYAELTGGQTLTVRWDPPAAAKATIPPSRLFRPNKTFYYLKTGTSALNLVSSWTTLSNGAATGGANPTNFTTANSYYVITNRTSVDLTYAWTVSGTSSRVILGNGSTTPVTLNFNAGSSLTGMLEARKNTVINLNTSTMPSFGMMDKTSTVNFNTNANVTLPFAYYGNVNITTPNVFTFPMSNVQIQGNLNVVDGATTAGTTTNASALTVYGNVVFNHSTGNPLPVAAASQYALTFTGGGTHNLSFVNPIDVTLFSLSTGAADVVNIVNPGTHTYTFGSTYGGGLSINGNFNIGGNNLIVTGRGTINAGVETGSIAINGGNITVSSTALTNSNLQFDPVNNLLNNLTLSVPSGNSVTLQNATNVKNLVTVSSGTAASGSGNLNLLSDVTGTARIGPLTNGARISGSISAQRYMDGEGRIYRYISSPVKGVKAADLQVYFPISGSFTGASTIPGVPNPGASMFWYAEPNYMPFPATGGTNQDTLRTGRGYTTFIREATNPTTWEVTGVPNQGNISYTLTGGTNSSNGWNLIGNPYPAPIVWTGGSTGGWTMNGVNVTVSVRENFGTQYQWRTWNGTAGNLTGGVIAPGQAFWVQASTATPTLTVGETAKQTTDGAFYRTGPPADVISIKMRNATLSDDAYIQLDRRTTPAFEIGYDAIKQANSFFSLSTLTSDNQPVAINMTTSGNCSQEIKLRITNAAVGSYSLDLSGATSLTSGETVVFTDAFTNTTVTLTGDYTHNFSITADAASKADGRFKISLTKPSVDLNKSLATEAACNQNDPTILVQNSQPGVDYTAYLNGTAVSQPAVGNGGTLSIAVDHTKLAIGKTELKVKAGFLSCSQDFVPATILVRRDSIQVPTITMNNGVLSASLDNVQYQWFKDNVLIDNATSKQYTPDGTGVFTVQTTSLSCDVTSGPFARKPLSLDLITSSDAVCNGDAIINIPYSQNEVLYTAYVNDIAVSQPATGNGAGISMTLDPALFGTGEKQVVIKAKFPNDIAQSLNKTVTVSRSVLPDPTVLVDGTNLVASQTGTSYKWFFNGVEIADATTKVIKAGSEGKYTVQITSGTCVKSSPDLALSFTVRLDQNLTAVSSCDSANPEIRIADSQPGVQYTAMYNSTAVSSTVVGTGSEIVLTLDNSTLGIGEKNISVQAGFANNTQYFFPTSVKVRHDVLPQPKIAINAGVLSADVADAQYAWFLNGALIPAATNKDYQPTESGSYTVVVTSGSCTKTSAPVDYAVTAIEDDPSYVNYSPNPTRDRLVVTTGIALDLSRVKMMSTLGQGIGIEMRRLSERSAELNLSDLSAGLYLLQVNGKTYRIVKE